MEIESSSLYDLAGILICLVLSAFFSGSETVLTSISPVRVNVLIAETPDKWGILNHWLLARRRILAALLIGNNLVNIYCSILVYQLAMRFFPNLAEAIAAFGLTIVILVFAEITPKGIALAHAETLAVPVMRIIWLLDKLLYPVAQPLSRLPILFRKDNTEELNGPPPTEDEIRYHIKRGLEDKVFTDKNQGELLLASINFDERLVKEVMVPRTEMTALEEQTTLIDALQAVVDSGHSRLPVFRNTPDTIVGLLYAKDILSCFKKNHHPEGVSLKSIMRKTVHYASELQRISTLLADMKRGNYHLSIVVDEFGGTAGIITLEDIIEELVGDIHDEHDVDEPEIIALDNNRWEVDAQMAVQDFEYETGLSIPESNNYESVGGFVVAAFGTIPRKGQALTLEGVRIVVRDADDRRVTTLEFKKLH